MPNLKPPVASVADAVAYRARILAALPRDTRFTPLMTLYLTDRTQPSEIERAQASGIVHGVKYYPAGATTNSDSGVTSITNAFPTLAAMERCGMPLLVHGEVTESAIDIFDRERAFVDTVLRQITGAFPSLKVVVEHVTTKGSISSSRRLRMWRRRSRRSICSTAAMRCWSAASGLTITACRS